MQIFNPFTGQKIAIQKQWITNLPQPHNYRTQIFLPILKRYLQANQYIVEENKYPAIAMAHANDILLSAEQKEQFHEEDIAILIIFVDYKKLIKTTDKNLTLAKDIRKSLVSTKEKIERISKKSLSELQPVKLTGKYLDLLKRFQEHMEDDINTYKAFQILSELDIYLQRFYENGKLETTSSINPKEYLQGATLFKFFLDIFGLKLEKDKKQLTSQFENIILETIKKLEEETTACSHNQYYGQKFAALTNNLRKQYEDAIGS